MQVEPRVKRFLIERIDRFRILLGDMCIAHVFAYRASIFTLGQRIVIAVTRARFSLLDAQFLKDSRDRFIDVLRTIIRVEAINFKRKLFDDQLQHGQ